jgi:hypothetical protein
MIDSFVSFVVLLVIPRWWFGGDFFATKEKMWAARIAALSFPQIKSQYLTCELTWEVIDPVEGTVPPVCKKVQEIFGSVIKCFYLYIVKPIKFRDMETAVKKSKKWKYHTHFSFTSTDTKVGIKHTFQTQLYQVGVYGIWDNRSEYQGNYTPNQIVSIEKKIRQHELKGKLKDLEFGREITVTTDENGLYVEVD